MKIYRWTKEAVAASTPTRAEFFLLYLGKMFLDDRQGGVQGLFLPEFQDPPVAERQAAQKVEAVTNIFQAPGRDVTVAGFDVIDVGIANALGLRLDKIRQP